MIKNKKETNLSSKLATKEPRLGTNGDTRKDQSAKKASISIHLEL